MAMNITDLEIGENLSMYSVVCTNSAPITVTVTNNSNAVAFWILMIRFAYRNVRREHSVVGLRIEWRRSLSTAQLREADNRVDILQLCAGEHCLVFQIRHADSLPQQLLDFSVDNNFTFVGIGIQTAIEMLYRDYGIYFDGAILDLRSLYALRLGVTVDYAEYYGLRETCYSVLGMDYQRPIMVTMSRWDALLLHRGQILFACVDAYVCHRLGISLYF